MSVVAVTLSLLVCPTMAHYTHIGGQAAVFKPLIMSPEADLTFSGEDQLRRAFNVLFMSNRRLASSSSVSYLGRTDCRSVNYIAQVVSSGQYFAV